MPRTPGFDGSGGNCASTAAATSLDCIMEDTVLVKSSSWDGPWVLPRTSVLGADMATVPSPYDAASKRTEMPYPKPGRKKSKQRKALYGDAKRGTPA